MAGLEDRRGSLTVDDEGTPTARNVLIEDGILKGFLQDRLNARLMGVAPTGNGRRESFAHAPMPRMTNTFMLAGDREPEEVIASVDRGLYAVQFGGGQVDVTSGKFVFNATEAYLIENGKVAAPVRGATLIGNGPDALTRVAMIGNDLALDDGIGMCGKGRPVRPRRRRPAHPPHRRHDRRRHGGVRGMADLAWPVDLEPQPDGTVLVSFPDIPEALTEGDTEEEALAEARDCLAAALEGLCRAPAPSAATVPGFRPAAGRAAGPAWSRNGPLWRVVPRSHLKEPTHD